MNKTITSTLAVCLCLPLLPLNTIQAEGPLPEFTFQGVALHPKNLAYSPNEDLIHPTIVKTEGRIKNPLGKFYLYHAPHKHIATSMAYSDSIEGPWTEYQQNPVVEGPSAPDVRWIEEQGKFFLWGHRKNSQTELWTSEDGIHFEYHSVSITAKNIGTRNATYSRMYEYPLEKYGSKYIMLYSGFIEDRGIRCVWLAHSKDAENWVQLKTPLVEPIEGEMNDCYGPSLFRWKGKNYVVYQDHTTWRGGNIKYVEVDQELSPVGGGGKRYVLLDPPDEPPLNNRYRGAEFYFAGGKIYLYSSASQNPRLIVYATAELDEPVHDELESLSQATGNRPGRIAEATSANEQPGKQKRKKQTTEVAPQESVSLDEILKDLELETVYETSFDHPIRMIHESELLEDNTIVRKVPQDIDWVLEGAAEVDVKEGRLHIKNESEHCVLWNKQEFPESFVAEWDFQHHAPQGTAIIFFAAQANKGGSIFMPGLPKRGGKFGKYTRGEINCYHTSYSATDEQGVPRGSTHLKKDGKDVEKSKLAGGLAPIDGKTDKPFRIRLAKLKHRIILEIDGEISFDVTDQGQQDSSSYASGQIGFRQMRHTIEASYGGLKIDRVKFPADKESSQAAETSSERRPRNPFPTVEELPPHDKLSDPFQFFGSDRRVTTRQDWEQRQAEMMEMLQHYIYGPVFPQVNRYKVESRTAEPLAGGDLIKHTANLKLGPALSHPLTVVYYLLANKESQSILIYVVAREEPQDEDAIEIAKRGYAYTALKVGPYEKIARDIYPKIEGTRTMGWVWGMNEIVHYLTSEHEFDKVIITGCSRYGRVALLTGALNKRIDLTAPITTLAHAVHHFDEAMWGPGNVKWGNQQYDMFAGKMNRLPVDRHFLGAVIAPRAYLGIMGAEKPAFNEGHVEAYEALIPVYQWLGARNNLGLYDHSPRGHGVELDDLHTVLDFSDLIFYDKQPASGKRFDQISNPDLVGFQWQPPAF